MAEDWTREEVEIIVAEYFEMLQKEQAGIPFSKTETRQRILPLLKNRSNGSVEFKNRNISAVLARMGQPYIRGYLPAYNYQKSLLEDVVVMHLRRKPEIEDAFKRFAEVTPTPYDLVFETMEEAMPSKKMILDEPELIYRSPVKVNYIELEQANRVIGTTGESIALAYEKWRLIQEGKENLGGPVLLFRAGARFLAEEQVELLSISGI